MWLGLIIDVTEIREVVDSIWYAHKKEFFYQYMGLSLDIHGLERNYLFKSIYYSL